MVSRNEILDAIKQTAKSNGGLPLGKGVFLKQTGIKESDWSGIHWARWNDAVEEAGFQPNTVPDRIAESVLFDN